MANVRDVAQYILEQQGQMTTWKLQKLVYYAQAWSLVWDERPLFDDRIEAWANGPVIRSLTMSTRGCSKSRESRGVILQTSQAQNETRLTEFWKRMGVSPRSGYVT
jgi:uncharacterized phage-associated protein